MSMLMPPTPKLNETLTCTFIQVYANLQPLGVCMSYQGTMNIVEKISEDHDVEVEIWADELVKLIKKPPQV